MATLGNYLDLNRCPHCSIDKPNLGVKQTFNTKDYAGKTERAWAVYICQNCGGAILAFSDEKGGVVSGTYPTPRQIDESIPERARAYLNQAVNSLHAPAGAVMLAASAVDAMLKNKGYTEGTLYRRINDAAKDHLITEDMKNWADEVRLDANEQRHADTDVPLPTSEDAQRTVDFALALAEFLFVLPSRVTRGLEDARKTKESDG